MGSEMCIRDSLRHFAGGWHAASHSGKAGQMDATEYDLIVIGAGPVGENVADRAVQGGLTAVIVESELVGGECSYWACMPSKTLLRPAATASSRACTPSTSTPRRPAPTRR